MSRDIDALTSSTLKHLRERWWNPEFAEFLKGCGIQIPPEMPVGSWFCTNCHVTVKVPAGAMHFAA